MRLGSFVVVATTLLSACATDPRPPHVTEDQVVFEAIALSIQSPHHASSDIEHLDKGDGFKSGAKILGASPIGCLGTGMFVGLCLAMAPFAPFIEAASVQDADKSRAELEAFLDLLAAVDPSSRFAATTRDALARDHVVIAEPEASASHAFTATLGAIDIEHNGMKDATIELTMPMTFALTDSLAQRELRSSAQNVTLRVGDEDFADRELLTKRLDRALAAAVQRGVGEALTNWPVEIELTPIAPARQRKRSFLGFPYYDWAFADSTAPRLEWQRLEHTLPQDMLVDITDVVYDVEITAYWYVEGQGYLDLRTVLEAHHLSSPEFAVDSQLEPCMAYRWRPTAHFRYRGSPRRIANKDMFLLKTPGANCREARWSFDMGS